jgi:hypothetical protein
VAQEGANKVEKIRKQSTQKTKYKTKQKPKQNKAKGN